jgi:hypothetical protein
MGMPDQVNRVLTQAVDQVLFRIFKEHWGKSAHPVGSSAVRSPPADKASLHTAHYF